MARKISLVLIVLILWQSFFNCPLQAQQPYPEEWYPPKLWEYYSNSGVFRVINNIPFVLKKTDETYFLTRINRNTGKPIYRIPVEDKYNAHSVLNMIAIGNGKLYVASYNNKDLTAYGLYNGNEIWRYDLKDKFTDSDARFDDIEPPMPICGKVLLSIYPGRSQKSYLICLDSDTGELLWSNNKVSRYIYFYVEKDNRIYCSLLGGLKYLFCIDSENGNIIWRTDLELSWDIQKMFIKDNYLFISIHDCCTPADYYTLLKLSNGENIFSNIRGGFKKINGHSPLMYFENKVVCFDDWKNTANLTCVDLDTNEELWKIPYTELDVFWPCFEDGMGLWVTTSSFLKPELSDEDYVAACIEPSTGKILHKVKGDIVNYKNVSFSNGRIYLEKKKLFVCFGDTAIGFDEPPSRIVE